MNASTGVDVSAVLIVIMTVLFACGVYAMLERSLTRVLIGFLLLGNATNLLLLVVMGRPGIAPFSGEDGEVSDPLPQALTLTAIVITFAVSAFLLALIYRSWQLGQADTVEDDEEDIALRERTVAEDDALDDASDDVDEDATTDFVDVQTAPIRILHNRDLASIVDDAPVNRPGRRRAEGAVVIEQRSSEDDPDPSPDDVAASDPTDTADARPDDRSTNDTNDDQDGGT